MQDPRIILACLIAACASALAIAVLRGFAEPLGLVDHPSERKHHVGSVPLVGGLAIFIGVLAGAVTYGGFRPFSYILLASAGVLAILGALDDRFDLSVRARLLVQTIVILTVIGTTGVYIHTLGHIFGYQLELGWIGVPLTVVAVIGLLNAFNMMDGIDGLAGSLALVSIAAIALFAGPTALRGSLVMMALLAVAILPYLAANLGFMGRKIFMGDAGSMVVGYLLAWTLIRLSQQPGTQLSPVDVLWCVAVPVLDTIAVMYRRLRQGKSPFKPDRGHIHHILLDAGLGPRRALLALVALAGSLAFVGSVTHSLGAGAGSNLTAFCIFAGIYVITANRIRVRQETRKRGSLDSAQSESSNVLVMAKNRKIRSSDDGDTMPSNSVPAAKASD
ncbi:MraY family glycosyltransferase [Rhodanobacter sp. Col0626]|uniref:MraY family glycosyltransferase n=1 Tax=Rhodanobacter sp. Col0626 TaxID=3415679 RepID=UPI003CF8AFF7